MKSNKNKGFTLAEVLITLSIIGVIAAILFPSILANYTERTLKAKRQALVARMSQAMGNMADTFRNYESVKTRAKAEGETSDPNCLLKQADCADNGSALKFINEGFSKVYKIAAVCDNQTLSACDIPDEVTRADGTTFSLKEHGKSILEYNTQISISAQNFPYNTDSAGIMTKNGESILLFYNPNCEGKITYQNYAYAETATCVNMIYDLNGGKKKPNRVGEDIGFLTVFYNDAPYVVSPKPYDWRAVPDYNVTNSAYTTGDVHRTKTQNYNEAKAACEALGENVALPTLQEGMSMLFNRELWAPREEQDPTYIIQNKAEYMYRGMWTWTNTMDSPTKAYMMSYASNYYQDNEGSLVILSYPITYKADSGTRCVYTD